MLEIPQLPLLHLQMVPIPPCSFLRFLNDGTYVQIAVNAQGYCGSAYKAFNVIADNITKFSITDGISIFFKILGMLGISVGIAASAYFCLIKI